MPLPLHLQKQCALHGITRGELTALLGLRNVNKVLRRWDALMQGAEDADLLDRIRACPQLAGEDFEAVVTEWNLQRERSRQEQLRVQEMKARRAFVPHVWIEHERHRPEHPFFVIAMLGIDHFKRIDLPDEIQACEESGQRLWMIKELIDRILDENTEGRLLNGPFGRAVTFFYRDTFDTAYAYNAAERRFLDHRPYQPRHGQVHLSMPISVLRKPRP
jgi:hypothetical protein